VILLARHGETPYNADGRFQGQCEVALNERGREQAGELAEIAAAHVPAFAALYCSPLRRAVETAAVVGARLGLLPRTDARFQETDTGDWTHRLFADVEREQPEVYDAYYATDPAFRFPGGESLQEHMDRVVLGLADVTRAGVLPTLVVCHRGVIAVAHAHTDPRGLTMFKRSDVPNGALVAL